MTDRELLLRVFHQQPVERIPVSPFIYINYVKEFFGSHDVDCVEKTPDVYRHFGFDLIHRNCSVDYDAYGPTGTDWNIETSTKSEGRDETTVTRIITPGGEIVMKDALRWIYEYEAEVSLMDFPVKSEADFELFSRYQPSSPDTADVSDIRKAGKAVGNRGITAPWIQSAFNLVAYYYRRVDDLLMDAILNPVFYNRMMNFFLSRYLVFIQQLIDAGVDVLSCGGNIANGKLVSPDFFRRFIWPFEKRLIDFIQHQGVPVLFHNCGYAANLLPLYTDLGMKAYESLTPAPYGDTDLSTAVKVFGRRVTLAGGIDQIDLLRKGTPEEIESIVKRVLDTVRGRSHFILGTTDYFNEETPEDNIFAFVESGKRYGKL